MGTILSTIISSVAPLAVKNQDALFRVFRVIRQTAMGNASAIVSLVMGIACLIIVIKLVKLTYDMESDEQAAGFGGVTLWQICRPVVILFALTIYPTLLGAIDSVADSLTTGIVKTADNQNTRAKIASLIEIVDTTTDQDATTEEVQEILSNNTEAKEPGNYYFGPVAGYTNSATAIGNWFGNWMFSNRRSTLASTEDLANRKLDEMTETELSAKETRKFKKNLRRAISAYFKVNKVSNADGFKLDTPATWLPALCKIIYDWGFIIIECGAEIMLCVLCFAGPVVLVVSLIDQYKHSFMEFIMRYFQFSFWKVAAAIINWAVESAQVGAVAVAKTMAIDDIVAVMDGAAEGAKAAGSASSALWVIAWISLAGIFCFSKIGDLAAFFIPVSGGSLASGAGTAVAAATGAVSGAASGAATVASVATGLRSTSLSQQQAADISRLAANQSREGTSVSQDD